MLGKNIEGQHWKEIYDSRIATVEDALEEIKSGDNIITGVAAGEPRYLFKKLVEYKDQFENVKIRQGVNIGDAPYAAPECEGHFIVASFFAGVNTRAAIRDGRAEMIPIHYYVQSRAIREKKIPVDVAMIQVTPPDFNGYVNLGLSCEHLRASIETARLVIAQVNNKYPYVCGDTLVHVSEIDYFVEYNEEPYQIPVISGDDPVSEAIGRNIATLINDGDCLQLGQGKVPNAILKCLMDKKDLGIHTEVFSDNLIPLIEKHVITGAKKNINPRKIVATFIQGTRALYDFVDGNNMINMQPCEYSNSVRVISQNDNMIAINSALQVDLFGQIVADTINGKAYSGVGGQLDFLRGAEESEGGKAIIALPATAKNGTVSRIIPGVPIGDPVTSTRHDSHFIVTEYGIACILGIDVKEKAKRIIDIAAPQFREGLEEEFYNLIKRSDN